MPDRKSKLELLCTDKGLKMTETRPGDWVVISGIGGLGQVHEAWDPLLSRTVAITGRTKLAAADPSGELRELIVTEPGVGYRVRATEP